VTVNLLRRLMLAEAVTPLEPTYPANSQTPAPPPGTDLNNEPTGPGTAL